MAKKVKDTVPTAQDAKAYVHRGIHAIGGWREGLGGLWHKSIPDLIGAGRSMTVKRVLALLARILMFTMVVLFPVLLRKLASPTDHVAPSSDSSLLDGVYAVFNAVRDTGPVDYVLAALALIVFGIPRVVAAFELKTEIGSHSPFKDLTAALQRIPVKDPLLEAETDETVRLTLSALREEMVLLIGNPPRSEVTEVTLLQFSDSDGRKMQVRARTANHEPTKKPIDSARFVAFYVALEGRNFAEHNFKNARNPFPPKRVTVGRGVDIDYRSVLYMPVISTVHVPPGDGAGPPQPLDICVGVICVHSSRPYRFWRWGDHKKGTGGFADVAFSRSLPYIAILERLLSRTVPGVRLEAK